MTASMSGDGLRQAIDDHHVAEWLGAEGLDVVHAGLFDTSGTLREKRLSAPAAVRALEHGWSFIDAIQYWGPDDRAWGPGGSVQESVILDPHSVRPYPFEPTAALILGDFAGPSAELSPRVLLARIQERARSLGLQAEVGWEFECIVLDHDGRPAGAGGVPRADVLDHDGRPVGAGGVPRAAMTTNRCWSALTPAAHAEVLGELSDTLAAGGVPLDHLCSELGPGCLELATAHRSALRAGDDAALMKLYTKAFFARRSQTATFMAQLSEDFPGLGGHPSLSLRSLADGRPALPDGPGALSKVGSSAVAGVVALLPELLVMIAPNPNSYRRFAPGNWAPRRATWGMGNYSCGVRVVSGGDDHTRLELRVPGADVDPHLGLAMFLGAAIWGIEGGLEPPDPVEPPADGRLHTGATPLPRSLAEAIDEFASASSARELFGSRFVEHYAESRRVEDEACRRFVPAGERQRYLDHV